LAFRGAFDYTLDAKSRLTVPAKFRAALSEGMVLARGIDPCVAIWRPEEYDRYFESSLHGVNPMSSKHRQLERFLLSNSFESELDSAGRVGMPAKLMDYARLTKDVVVAGAGNRIEVWDRVAWSSYDADVTAEISDIAESLGHPG
jgi:MraZ protein